MKTSTPDARKAHAMAFNPQIAESVLAPINEAIETLQPVAANGTRHELLDLLESIAGADVHPAHVAYLSKARICELARAALQSATL